MKIKLTSSIEKVVQKMTLARNAIAYVLRGDYEALARRFSVYNYEKSCTIPKSSDQMYWGIISTKHTQFIAHLIAERLQVHGWNVDVMTSTPKDFHHDWYLVICPQMFKKLPPEKKRFVFQMEQSVSSRWMTKEYLKLLKNSLAIFEYSLVNIDFLTKNEIPYQKIYYIPVGASSDYGSVENRTQKMYDILFYGDYKSSSRRKEMLKALKNSFNVHIVSEVFGTDIRKIIKQSRLVINLHYYENALLEMPRIQECLSLGVPVLSESAQDQDEYPELVDAVKFFKQGSISEMLATAENLLKQPTSSEAIKESIESSSNRFSFMFDRFLIAFGFLDSSYVSTMKLPIQKHSNRIALSLPETISRRYIFKTGCPKNCITFDGIRRTPSWIGCGLSYQALAKNAIKEGKKRLTIMEDDVLLPSNFEDQMTIINEFLNNQAGEWDIFAGMISSFHPQTKILSVEVFKGITFVKIDKITSMVFNIYNESALKILATWDPDNTDKVSNTIDRFLEKQNNLQVVIILPFFVGHREDVYSTLWGFQNTRYHDLIKHSEQSLQQMVLNE